MEQKRTNYMRKYQTTLMMSTTVVTNHMQWRNNSKAEACTKQESTTDCQIDNSQDPLFLVQSNNETKIWISLQVKKTNFTCTSTSCFFTELIRIEKRDRSTPLGKRVASANKIAADMIPRMTARTFLTCFIRMHRQTNSAKAALQSTKNYAYCKTIFFSMKTIER